MRLPNPLAGIERLLDKQVERELARERILVTEGHDHERRVWLRSMGRFVLGLACLIPYGETGLFALDLALGGALGWIIATATLSNAHRAHSYKRGWLDGRHRMVKQGQHHQEQGNSPRTWLETEANHDFVHVMGLPPLPMAEEDR